MSLRIAFVYDVIYPWVKGGVEKRIHELAVRLAREHEVHVYGYKLWEGRREIERDGVFYHGTVRVRPSSLYRGGRRSVLPPLVHSVFIPRLIRGKGFDVVDCQASPYLPAHSLRLSEVENVFITWHEFWGDYWLEYLGPLGVIGREIERGLFTFERHIAVSSKTRFDLIKAGLKKPVSLVPNGIDVASINSTPPAELSSDFIFVGRLIPEKGVDFLLRSLALLKGEFPDFRAIIIGDGPLRGELEELSRRLGLGNNVVFTGFLGKHSEVISLMKSSRVFAFPSRREGFGMVVLEAMASGLPIVTVSHPMNASVYLVEDGKTGFVTNLDERDFARALLLAHERMKMGALAKRIAVEYDWDRIVERLLMAYGVVS
jgi:glycosyltransferase involved in cell wall biosynthesis